MVKARGKTPGGADLLLIGLSRENCRRLLKKQPIVFDAAEVGLPGLHVTIMAGETEADIGRELRQHGMIGPKTSVHGEPS